MIERLIYSLENINENLYSIKYCDEGFISFSGITLDKFGRIHRKYENTQKVQNIHELVLHNSFMNL